MAIIIRHEHMIQSGHMPVSTTVYDMDEYKPALFGDLSDEQIRTFNIDVNRLERLAKEKTYDVFKQFPKKENVTPVAEAAAAAAKEHINQLLEEINDEIKAARGKLVVRLADGNWFKKRTPRIVSHWSYDANSPRIMKAKTKDSDKFESSFTKMSVSSDSAEKVQGSAAVAAATVQRPMTPRRLVSPSPLRRSSTRDSSNQRSKFFN